MFEGKVQDPKRTLTNGKDTHMHVVARQNQEQAFQHMASGGSWDAVELSPTNKREVVAVHRVKAGPKLIDLIAKHYPQLNPTATSVATVKSQVSSIAVQDFDVLSHLMLQPSRVALREVHELVSAHRAAPVITSKHPPPPEPQSLPVQLAASQGPAGSISAPSFESFESAIAYFGCPSQVFPSALYGDGSLRAYRKCSIFTPGDEGTPLRKLVGSIRGWPKGGNRGGSKVKVLLPGDR